MTAQSDVVQSSAKSCSAVMKSETGTKSGKRARCSESRKIRKPLMEKRRRARINHSLNELKRILLEANGAPPKKEGSRPAKLEKADILELTVRHLQSLHQQSKLPGNMQKPVNCTKPLLQSPPPNPPHANLPLPAAPAGRSASPLLLSANSMPKSQWLTGFKECIRMVSSSLNTLKAEDGNQRCTTSPSGCADSDFSRVSSPGCPDMLRDLASLSDKFIDEEDHRVPCMIRPSRLPNGDIAFVIKCSQAAAPSLTPSMYNLPTHNSKVKVEEVSPKCNMYNSFYSSSSNDNHQDDRYLWRPW